jgi:hypothetical protein
MIVFSSLWRTGRTFLPITIPFDDSGIFGLYDSCHGAPTSVAAMQVKISLRLTVSYCCDCQTISSLVCSVFRIPAPVRRNQISASFFMNWLAHGRKCSLHCSVGVALGAGASANAKGCIKGGIVGGVARRFRRICATNKQRVWCLVDRNQVRFGGVSPKLALGGRES